jgi:hypothetical protein
VRWFRHRAGAKAEARPAPAPVDEEQEGIEALIALLDADVFVCSTCGRTDLPPAGGWDPPICSECDAAINFDALLAAGYFDDH